MTKQQYAFHFDASRCTGCKTCVVACKDKNNIQDPRIQFRRVYEEAGGEWSQDEASGAWSQNVWAYFVSVSCNHCDRPACAKVCPTGAHAKHDELGGLVRLIAKSASDAGPVRSHVPMKRLSLTERRGKCASATCASIAFRSMSFRCALQHVLREHLISERLRNCGQGTATTA